MPKRAKDAAASQARPGRRPSARVVQILDCLEKHYGPPKRPYPTDPYEMLLHRNAGYPQSDERCDKGFQALKKQIGLAPKQIFAASDEALCDAARQGGMMPELRAQCLRDIAARVLEEFGGDMRAVSKRPLPDAKRALKKFPTVADATADKILLFSKTARYPTHRQHSCVDKRRATGFFGRSAWTVNRHSLPSFADPCTVERRRHRLQSS